MIYLKFEHLSNTGPRFYSFSACCIYFEGHGIKFMKGKAQASYPVKVQFLLYYVTANISCTDQTDSGLTKNQHTQTYLLENT